eukprot:347066-Alexandrium_andersonii.AAC.1
MHGSDEYDFGPGEFRHLGRSSGLFSNRSGASTARREAVRRQVQRTNASRSGKRTRDLTDDEKTALAGIPMDVLL